MPPCFKTQQPMALQREIWINDIVEGLFADNTFAARSIDHSQFVNNLLVHVPNAGAAPAVVKNRTKLPADVKHRTDIDLTYLLAEFTTDPVHIPHAETVELSYDKRASVLAQVKASLMQSVHDELLQKWASAALYSTNSGANIPNGIKDLVAAAQQHMNEDDLPQHGRCLLLNAEAYTKLIKELTGSQGMAFLSTAKADRGTVGQLFGFDVYLRSQLPAIDEGNPYALFWQEQCVSRALGNTDLFNNTGDALWYGDIMSALVRAGGSRIRSDKKGVEVLYTEAPAPTPAPQPNNGDGDGGNG